MPHPVLLLMHGFMSDEADLLALGQELLPDVAIVSVRAPIAMSPGYSWFEFQNGMQPDPITLDKSLTAVEEIIGQLHTIVPHADPSRLLIGGFSQGGAMTAALACRRRGRGILGAMVLSGYLPDYVCQTETLSGLPLFWGHGRADPVIPVSRAEIGSERFRSAGARVTFRPYPTGHSVTPQEIDDINQWMSPLLGPQG
ncbi:MAG: dienelactone hydrolase family protein [Thermaerobacter sp.]|nr:dienelactone hydrolase family protein [Thermaerobacter sp.]